MTENKMIWSNFWVQFMSVGAIGTILFAVLSYIWMAKWLQFTFLFFAVLTVISFIGSQVTLSAWIKSKISTPVDRYTAKDIFFRLSVAWLLWAVGVVILFSTFLSLDDNLYWLLMAIPATFLLLSAWSIYRTAEKPAAEQG